MKKYSYLIPRTLTHITGVIFLTQVTIRLIGITDAKPGFEWVLPACGAAFSASVVYSLVILVLNVRARKK